MIRRFIPKGFDATMVTEALVRKVDNWLNRYPLMSSMSIPVTWLPKNIHIHVSSSAYWMIIGFKLCCI